MGTIRRVPTYAYNNIIILYASYIFNNNNNVIWYCGALVYGAVPAILKS